MNLTFHDRTGAPSPKGDAAFTIGKEGTFTLNAVAVRELNLKKGSPVLLVQDADTNAWFLVFGTVVGREHFTLLARNANATTALSFHSLMRAQAYYAANELSPEVHPSAKLRVELKPVKHEGLKLYPLVGLTTPTPIKRAATAIKAVAATKPVAVNSRPDEATMYRLNETVRTLAGLQLHKRQPQELTRAYGLLNKYPSIVEGIVGGTALLQKLKQAVG